MHPRPLRLLVGIDEGSDPDGITEELEAHGIVVGIASGRPEILRRAREGSWDLVAFRTSPLAADMFLLAGQLQAAEPSLAGRILFLPDDARPSPPDLFRNLARVMDFLSTRRTDVPPDPGPASQERSERGR